MYETYINTFIPTSFVVNFLQKQLRCRFNWQISKVFHVNIKYRNILFRMLKQIVSRAKQTVLACDTESKCVLRWDSSLAKKEFLDNHFMV